MIITLGSIHGSPGVTSWTLLLAAAWPDELASERVVLEADPAGGVLGARFDMGVAPGVVSLISAMRHADGSVIEVAEHARRVAANIHVVPGPETGEQARQVWRDTAADVADVLADDHRLWLVDVGRIDETSLVLPLALNSACVLLVCGPHREDLVQVPARVETLDRLGVQCAVLVVGDPFYRPTELAGFFGTPHAWTVKRDADLALLAGELLRPGRARRSMLWRNAVGVAAELAPVVHAPLVEGRQTTSLAQAAGRA